MLPCEAEGVSFEGFLFSAFFNAAIYNCRRNDMCGCLHNKGVCFCSRLRCPKKRISAETHGFDRLELIDVRPPLVAGITPIALDPAAQNGARIVRDEEQRAFGTVVVPLRTKHDDLQGRELQRRRHLDRLDP